MKTKEIKKEEIKEIERRMNQYPRRPFEEKSSEEIYKKLFRKVYGKKFSKGRHLLLQFTKSSQKIFLLEKVFYKWYNNS